GRSLVTTAHAGRLQSRVRREVLGSDLQDVQECSRARPACPALQETGSPRSGQPGGCIPDTRPVHQRA
ncbi:hypothetical protein OC846_006914, partial [Tilletia horrida]